MNRIIVCLMIIFTLTACSSDNDGKNSPATFGGQSTGTVDINNASVSGELTVTDSNNNEDVFLVQQDTSTVYGTFSILAGGIWLYELDVTNADVIALGPDSSVTELIFVSSFDGTTTPVTITINGVYIASAATFSGDLSSAIAADSADPLTGTVTVTDANEGEDTIEIESGLMTMYGTFSITETGAWTYTLDTTNASVTALTGSDTLDDIIQISSADGTTTDITITISGQDPIPTNKTKVAVISDTMDNDAGELRYRLSSAVPQGKLSISFLREDGIVTGDGTSKDGFITLYGSSTSGANALVDLRVRESSYSLRNESDVSISTAVAVDTWTDVEITWDASNASDTVAPTLTIYIDGVDVTGSFSSGAGALDTVKDGVQFVAFKLGDTTAVIPAGSFLFDDLKIYSDMAGTTIAFEDDFESYLVGDSLGTDNPNSPYHSATADTVIAEVDAPVRDIDPGEGDQPTDNQVVSITDTTDSDAGELRYRLGSAIPTGKMTVSFLREDGILTGDGTSKDGFISLYGSSTSGANALVDLRIRESSYSLRNESDVSISTAVNVDTWTDVEISWDASSASDTVAPTLTIKIDDVDVTGSFSSGAGSLDTVKDGVQFVAFKLGDTSAVIPTGAFLFDDLKIYSDLAGTTIDFEDDFESYSVGDALSTDNGNSPYHSSTFEAVIVLE